MMQVSRRRHRISATSVKATSDKIAAASFTAAGDEAMALLRALPKLECTHA